jgi:hypothetical protein
VLRPVAEPIITRAFSYERTDDFEKWKCSCNYDAQGESGEIDSPDAFNSMLCGRAAAASRTKGAMVYQSAKLKKKIRTLL